MAFKLNPITGKLDYYEKATGGGSGDGIADSPSDGFQYARQDAGWSKTKWQRKEPEAANITDTTYNVADVADKEQFVVVNGRAISNIHMASDDLSEGYLYGIVQDSGTDITITNPDRPTDGINGKASITLPENTYIVCHVSGVGIKVVESNDPSLLYGNNTKVTVDMSQYGSGFTDGVNVVVGTDALGDTNPYDPIQFYAKTDENQLYQWNAEGWCWDACTRAGTWAPISADFALKPLFVVWPEAHTEYTLKNLDQAQPPVVFLNRMQNEDYSNRVGIKAKFTASNETDHGYCVPITFISNSWDEGIPYRSFAHVSPEGIVNSSFEGYIHQPLHGSQEFISTAYGGWNVGEGRLQAVNRYVQGDGIANGGELDGGFLRSYTLSPELYNDISTVNAPEDGNLYARTGSSWTAIPLADINEEFNKLPETYTITSTSPSTPDPVSFFGNIAPKPVHVKIQVGFTGAGNWFSHLNISVSAQDNSWSGQSITLINEHPTVSQLIDFSSANILSGIDIGDTVNYINYHNPDVTFSAFSLFGYTRPNSGGNIAGYHLTLPAGYKLTYTYGDDHAMTLKLEPRDVTTYFHDMTKHGFGFVSGEVIYTSADLPPADNQTGMYFWGDTTNNTVYLWNGVAWALEPYSLEYALKPVLGIGTLDNTIHVLDYRGLNPDSLPPLIAYIRNYNCDSGTKIKFMGHHDPSKYLIRLVNNSFYNAAPRQFDAHMYLPDTFSPVIGWVGHLHDFSQSDSYISMTHHQQRTSYGVFGNHVNHSKFELDGTLKMVGAAKVWKDLIIHPSALGVVAGSAPDLISFHNSGLLKIHSFDGAATMEQLYGSFELQHDYAEETDLDIHVHWTPTTADAGNVKWQFEYSIANTDSEFSTPVIVSSVNAAGGTAWKHHYSDIANVTGTGIKIGAIIQFRLFRDPTDSEDDYPADAGLLSIGVHYECDTLGSREELTK